MKIDPFSLPLSHPFATAGGTMEDRAGYLVRLSVDGVRGVGEATPLPGWTESPADCQRALERARDVAATDGPNAALAALDAEETPAARHGVALAIGDARARAEGVPLHRHLGGEERVERVPVNATVGDLPADETLARADTAASHGFSVLKVKVGARPLEEDLDRLLAVRDTLPGVELRADANGAWTPETAEQAFELFEPLDISYIEQPLPASHLAEHADLGGTIDVALDEGLAKHGPDVVLAAEAADVLILKPMVLGGPDRTREVALRARAAGLDTVVTTTMDGAIARTGAVHVAASLSDVRACGLATGDWLERDVLSEDPVPVEAGHIHVPQRPGNAPRVDDA